MQAVLTNDADLLPLLRAGDKAAFEEIYNRYRLRLYRAALSKVRTSENAMEIVQEIFLDLWLRREQVVIEDLERYLFSATKYKVLDFFKKEFTRRHYAETVQLSAPEESCQTEETLAYNELSRSISQCIDSLPEKTRVIFEMNRIQYKSPDEISYTLGVPLRTVEYHITQGLKALRASLREYLPALLLAFSSWI